MRIGRRHAAGAYGLAGAQAPDPLPKGPFVDFCPTPEQVTAHLEMFGFDYKPTVPCTADGEVKVAPGQAERQAVQPPESEAVRRAREKSDMSRWRRAPDTDGNPATMESITPEGEPVTIIIQTSEPERFRGMTPADLTRTSGTRSTTTTRRRQARWARRASRTTTGPAPRPARSSSRSWGRAAESARTATSIC